jgi:glycosyltransferase involved in cell wall biosynthesis
MLSVKNGERLEGQDMAARKVVHVITRLDRGGSAQNTMVTALGHDRTQFEPIVVTGPAGSQDAQGGLAATNENVRRLEKEGIRCHVVPSLVRHVNPWQDLLAFLALVRILRQERPDLVHTHTSKAGFLGRLAAWIAGVPVIVHTPHGHVFYGHFGRLPSWMFLQIERRLARITDCLIGLTEAERAEHLDRGVGRAERFRVVPSAIDLDRFRRARVTGKAVPEWFGCPPDARIVGSVGWLTDIKGHRFLVEAVAEAKKECPDLHLVIVGSGDQHDALLAQAENSGIAGSVHLVGHRDDIEVCLAGFDCFVLPSLNEGMGRALIEAMAAGLPVIASRVGGIPALIRDGENGMLVPAGDSHALADALRRLFRQPQWAGQLGAAASQGIGSAYGVEAMVRAIEALYREVCRTYG